MLECHWNNSQKVHCSSLVAYCKYCKSHLFFNFPLQNGWFLGSFVSFGCEIESDEEWLNGIVVLTCLSPSHTSVTAATVYAQDGVVLTCPVFLSLDFSQDATLGGVCNSDMLYMSPALEYVRIVYKATAKQLICRQDCRFDWSTWSCFWYLSIQVCLFNIVLQGTHTRSRSVFFTSLSPCETKVKMLAELSLEEAS